MKHFDFELEKYQKELHHEVNSLIASAEEGATKEGVFTEYLLEILSDAEVTDGTRICHWARENKWENTESKINGFAVEEGYDGKAYDGKGYETIDLFITHYKESIEPFNLMKPEFDNLIKWPSLFLADSLKGYLSEEIEISNEAFGLSRLIQKSRKELSRVNIFILTNGGIRHEAPKKFDIKGFENITIIFHIWDIKRLLQLTQSKYNREPIEIDFLKEKIPCLQMPLKNDLYECYLAIMPGSVLSNLYHTYGSRLLESNVRAFLQQIGKINRGIRDTILREPEMFLTYNNGLATSAQEVKTEMREDGQMFITKIKDFQIVNGGQTTASLFYTHKKFKEKADLSKVFVQVKLTVIKDERKKSSMVPNIAKFANSQNKVSELDLSSNSPFLQSLEALSKITYAQDPSDPNKLTLWFFERVRGQYREELNKCPTKSTKDTFKNKFPRNQIIKKSEVARFMNIWNQYPYEVARGSQKNYIPFMKIVNKEYSSKKPGRIYWENLVANAILFKTADKLFGRKNQDPIGDTLIKIYTVTYTLSFLHHKTNNLIDLESIWKKQIIEEDFKEEIKKGLRYVYHFFESLNVPLVSEAAKRKETWEQLLKTAHNSPFDMPLLNKYLTTKEQKTNREVLEKKEKPETSKTFDRLQKILSMGTKFWDGLCIYNTQHHLLSDFIVNIAKTISKKYNANQSLTQNEIINGENIINELKDKGIDFDDIKNLSRIEKDKVIDISKIYHKLKKITDAEWDRNIEIGRVTQKLNYLEISTMKAVRLKLKREGFDTIVVDFPRLKIVCDSMKKLETLKKYSFSSSYFTQKRTKSEL